MGTPMDPGRFRGQTTGLWATLTRDVKAAIDRLTGMRRVQAIEEDGRITVASTDPLRPAPVTVSRLRGSPFSPGDDVVTIRVAGYDYAIGSVARESDQANDQFEDGNRLAVVYTMNAATFSFPNQAAAEIEIGGNRRMWGDLTGRTYARLTVNVGTAGTAATFLKAQYSSDQTTWSDFAPSDTSDQASFVVGGTCVRTAWIPLPAAAQAEVCLRLVVGGGDGVADPSMGLVTVQVR